MYCAIGDRPSVKIGIDRAIGAKGNERARHMKAFESAPPKPPE